MQSRTGDRLLLVVLAIVLICASIAVTIQFLRPSGMRENLDAVMQDCLVGIISAAQKWHRSSSLGGADRRGWEELSFDKLGYDVEAHADLLTMTNSNARYIIRIAQDRASFDLIAESRKGRVVIYRNITDAVPPDPEVR